MRLPLVVAGLVAAAAIPVQAKDPPKAPAAAVESVRYVPLYGDLLGELSAEAFLKETRQGNKLVSAEIDVCHAIAPRTERKDRFVIPLKVEGGKLVGSGESAAKVPVSVELVRKVTGKTLAFQGSITHGNVTDKVDLADLSEQTAEEFQESQPTGTEITEAPAAFGAISPIALAVQVKRDALPGLVQALRGENVHLSVGTLHDVCYEMRSGQQAILFEVDAERASALVAKLRALPGVTKAGWTNGSGADWAVRFAASSWRGAKGLDRERLAAKIGEIAAGTVGATSHEASWDAVTGKLKLKLKRPSTEVAPSLGLTDVIELQLVLAPETLAGGERAVLWLETATLNTVDDGAGPRLNMSDVDDSEGEGGGGAQVDTEALLAAFAAQLPGQRWDGETSAWK
jgi:hypothetical protein